MEMYIDFGVAPYALADVCEALFKCGVTNGFITKEDGDLHIRWKYNINRGYPICKTDCPEGQTPIVEEQYGKNNGCY